MTDPVPQVPARTPYNQAVYDAHDQTCTSLPHFKFFRPGGRCCITCFGNCEECGDPFYWEGMTSDPRDEDMWDMLCECCLRKIKETLNG